MSKLMCKGCGKVFRSLVAARFHSEHCRQGDHASGWVPFFWIVLVVSWCMLIYATLKFLGV